MSAIEAQPAPPRASRVLAVFITVVRYTLGLAILTYGISKLFNFQFQVSTISKGFDAAEYFTKYPGRFMSMHVQDWSSVTKKTMAVGQGTLDWTKIFTAAKTGGLKNYFVEMNLELMKASVPFLRQLQV